MRLSLCDSQRHNIGLIEFQATLQLETDLQLKLQPSHGQGNMMERQFCEDFEYDISNTNTNWTMHVILEPVENSNFYEPQVQTFRIKLSAQPQWKQMPVLEKLMSIDPNLKVTMALEWCSEDHSSSSCQRRLADIEAELVFQDSFPEFEFLGTASIFEEFVARVHYINFRLYVILREKTRELNPQITICKQILDEKVATDCTIVAKNNKKIRCHRNFLFVHSAVLNRIAIDDLDERGSVIISMNDMSEEGVNALLAFIYTKDINDKIRTNDVSVELLQAAYNFQMNDLREIMLSFFMEKEEENFPVLLALNIFKAFRTSRAVQTANLVQKALRVMKAKYGEMQMLPSFMEFFQKEGMIAMELFQQLIIIQNSPNP